ncbi:DUF4126 family protein [Aestuariicella sp. G3-2]|uniref:DUF4126 family protein n=1 Tax=Pseudomaricurvus albidus TaxID=2842452 RepID=UPI001C0DAE0C|nr:DUF4126 family protein [Aestuariicella albida]MBU3070159.1 DUF4126 family protein [Aestuariicella albida]
MESYQALLATLALTMGASWASGINLYAVLLVLGIGGSTGNIDLPPGLEVLTDPMVIGAAGLMYFVEFFVDKTPGVDTAWDSLHTFIRIPAGAMLAAGAVGDVSPALEVAAGIMGGTLSATSHATKAGTRALINTSPEPFTNWTASITEDLLVLAGLWTALNHPIVFLGLMLLFIILAIWLLPKIWRLIKALAQKIASWFGGKPEPSAASSSGPTMRFGDIEIPDHAMALTASANASDSARRSGSSQPNYTAAQQQQLDALKTLREAGTISEEEFQAAKAKILGQ